MKADQIIKNAKVFTSNAENLKNVTAVINGRKYRFNAQGYRKALA